MIVSIFALMLLLGLGATAVGVVVLAIVTRKLWLIPAGAAIVVLGLMGLGITASLLFGFAPRSVQTATVSGPSPTSVVESVSFPTNTAFQSPPPVAYSSGLKINATLLLILGVVLVAAIVRRVFGPPHGHGILRAWPVLVVLGFFAVWFLLRVNTAYDHSALNAQMAREAAEQQQIVRSQLEAAGRRQILQQHPGAIIVSQKSVPLAEADDIHELMNQFDQPRIPLSPQLPTPPAPPSPTAAPPAAAAPTAPAPATVVAVMSADAGEKTASISVETKKTDTKKSSSTASQKRKKPKSSNSDSAKATNQAVAESKPRNDSQNQKLAVEKEAKLAAEAPLASVESSEPKARPAWVDQGPKRTGNVPREVIATDEYQTSDECYQAADIYLLLKTYQHIQQLVGAPYAEGPLPSLTFRNGAIFGDGKPISYGRGNNSWVEPDDRLRALRSIGITVDYLRREIVSKDPKTNEPREYIETVDRSFGPMKKLYLQIEFTPATDRELRRYWEARERAERFAAVGVGAGSLLGMLGLVFALLKIDTWTKGYYTKRLFIGVPAAIIAGFLLLVMLVAQHNVYR